MTRITAKFCENRWSIFTKPANKPTYKRQRKHNLLGRVNNNGNRNLKKRYTNVVVLTFHVHLQTNAQSCHQQTAA